MIEQLRWPANMLVLVGAIVLIVLIVRLLRETRGKSVHARLLAIPTLASFAAGVYNFGRTITYWVSGGGAGSPPLTEFGAFMNRTALLLLLIATIFCVREESRHG